MPVYDEVNVANLFMELFTATQSFLQDFSLLSYDSEKGQPLTSISQLTATDETVFQQYYHNHRVLQHGNLTGMILFQSSSSWKSIKVFKSTYFLWLKSHCVFLNYTKFKTDTLVVCGFLLSTHLGHLRRDEAEVELRGSLGLDLEEFPFQLSSRTISVPIKEGESGCFSFQAAVVETAAQHANHLREKFYLLEDPKRAAVTYQYTGINHFFPVLKSKEWSISKIYQLSRLHVAIIEDLKTIYIQNLPDLNNLVADQNISLLHWFDGLEATSMEHNHTGHVPSNQLIHSVHNMANKLIKVVLVQTSKNVDAIGHMESLENIIRNNIAVEYHPNVLIPGKKPSIMGQRVDSISSCNYSNYASNLLVSFNPQDDAPNERRPNIKRIRQTRISYAAAVVNNSNPPPAMTPSPIVDIEAIYDKIKRKFDAEVGSMDILMLESQVQQTSTEISVIRNSFEEQLENVMNLVTQLSHQVNSQHVELATPVQQLSDTIARQNAVIAAIQQEFKSNMTALTQAILPQLSKPPTVTPASTSFARRPGEQG